MTKILSIRGAARQLGKSHSTICRYVQAHPELNHGTARRPLVDVEELAQHRAANINAARSGSHAGRLLGEDNGADAANGWERPTRNQADAPSLATAKAAHEAVLAERAQLELAERLSHLLVRSEVLEAFEETLDLLRRQLSDLAPRLAGKLVTVGNAKEAQVVMEREYRGLLEKCAAELRAWA